MSVDQYEAGLLHAQRGRYGVGVGRMTCQACAAAMADSLSGLLQDGCRECDARQMSRSLIYARAEAKGQITAEYRDALEAVFGADWMAGHRLVKGWRARELA